MNNYKRIFFVLFLFIFAGFISCKKQWDEHTAGTDQRMDKNLIQAIQENSNLSTFAGYLTKLGYDKILASTKNYTVWAPDNEALKTIDAATVADTAKLRQFVNNHLANTAFLTIDAKPLVRVKTFGGKRVSFTATTFEEAGITNADNFVNNGVLHIINKGIAPKLNIYEFIKSLSTVGLLHRGYILGQDTTFVDTTKATVSSIDPVTGKPILVPGTGVVTINKYAQNVAKINSEDSLYTYFVLTDNAYNAERNKVSRFFTTVSGSTDTTMNILAAFNVLKDVAVKGLVKPEVLPATLQSVYGINIPVDKSSIIQTYAASNGIVYVIGSMNFALADKIRPIVVQGEVPSFFTRTDRRSNYAYRVKKDPTGVQYNDLLVFGSGLPASYYAAYKLSNLYTCQYKVVWRAINDFAYATPTNISQRLGFAQVRNTVGTNGFLPLVQFPYTNVTPLNYNEVQLVNATNPNPTATGTISIVGGTLNVNKYASINMFLQGSTSTVLNANIFTADYITLIPIL